LASIWETDIWAEDPAEERCALEVSGEAGPSSVRALVFISGDIVGWLDTTGCDFDVARLSCASISCKRVRRRSSSLASKHSTLELARRKVGESDRAGTEPVEFSLLKSALTRWASRSRASSPPSAVPLLKRSAKRLARSCSMATWSAKPSNILALGGAGPLE